MRESKKICDLADMFENNIGLPHKYYALGGRIEENKEKIVKGQLRKKKSKIEKQLESICKDYEERNSMENDKQFLFGFAMGVQLIAEAFSIKIQ